MGLGLDGWVANAADGSVRCVAEGPRDRLEILLDRLRDGSGGGASSSASARPGCPPPGRSGRSRSAAAPIAATDRVDPIGRARTGPVGYSVTRPAERILRHDGAELCRRGAACPLPRRPRSRRRARGATVSGRSPNRVRADAIAIYSRAWDERARRDLEALLRRNAARAARRAATGGRGFRRRTHPHRLTPREPPIRARP